MKLVKKLAIGVTAALVACGLVLACFAPNIRGYYRFKHYCETEGGLRIYGKVRRGEGWLSDRYDAASFEGVPFVRKHDRDGRLVDYRYKGGPPGNDRSYEVTPANAAAPVAYELSFVNQHVPGEVRLQRIGYELRAIDTGKLLLRWYQFGYRKFDRTPLAMPYGVDCHSFESFFAPSNYFSYFID